MQRIFSDADRIPLFDGNRTRGQLPAEILQHLNRLCGSEHDGGRIPLQNAANACGMVGFGVMNDEIVEFSPAERALDVFQKQIFHRSVGGVEKNGLSVNQQIGIIGNAARHGIGALEQREPPITRADVK